MSEGKDNGKGKSHALFQEIEDPTPSNEPPNSHSLFSRITASAAGLTRSTFTAPTANELSNQTATTLATSGKGQALNNHNGGSSAWAESSKAAASQGEHGQANGAGSAGLRNRHHDQHIQQSENEFSSFLDGIDSFTPSEGFVTSADTGLEDVLGEDGRKRSQASYLHNSKGQQRTVAEQETRDGEDVLALLSSPAGLEDEFEDPLEDEDSDWGLSSEQLIQIRAMAKEIFPPQEPHIKVAVDHPLNLNPSFEGEMIEAREHWREQWDGVLTRYTDEVWGGLLPLVKQAKQEMKEMGSEGTIKEKPTALRRLEAILGHLKKR
ncbi:hypothetical protein N431DRAFT_439315 [Stipitochalara longipes BDJ]|nr:hypothetical protein N431DRAFT_439315 [Stipitochalara longipes BDJ]